VPEGNIILTEKYDCLEGAKLFILFTTYIKVAENNTIVIITTNNTPGMDDIPFSLFNIIINKPLPDI
jgi:hypothetical protein